MRRIGITVAKLTDWHNRALAGVATVLKKRERDSRDDEIARLKSKVGEITMVNELLEAKIAANEGKRPLRRIPIIVVLLAMLASAVLGYSCSQKNPPAPIVSAPPVPLVSTPPAVSLSSRAASGCGSHGGPGYRLPSGKCASWAQQRHSPKRSQKN